jgi:ubiquinone/menaquinone biosynthesis C-methylase UbiE
MTGSNKTHPWELAWREQRWAETSPPLPVVAYFAEDLKREGAKRVLDLGCGAGRHSILLGKTGFQVVALDVSETALKALEARLKTASIDNVTLVKHEMHELPFVDNYFDGVVCTNVLHHGRLVEIKRAIRELHRVMRRRSSAFVVVLSAADFRKGNGIRLERNTNVFTRGEERGIIHHFFSREELRSCFRSFRIVSFEERFIPVDEGGNRAHFLVKLRKP